jgi:hypothetical protein
VKPRVVVLKFKNNNLVYWTSGGMADENVNCPCCDKLVNDGIYCDGVCKSWFHAKCVSLSEEDFSKIQELDDKVKWYCPSCSVKVSRLITKVSKLERAEEFDDLLNINSVINKLITVVDGVVNDNVAIKDKLNNLLTLQNKPENKSVSNEEEVTTLSTVVESHRVELQTVESQTFVPSKCSANQAIPPAGVDCKDFQNLCDSDTNITLADRVGSNVYPNLTIKHKQTEDSGNINSKHVSYSEAVKNSTGKKLTDNKKTLKSNQNPNRPKTLIIGTNDNKIGLKSVVSSKWVFISRCSIDTSVNDIDNYLNESGIPGCKSEKLQTKYPTYTSFKVSVPLEKSCEVLSGDFWPKGIMVKEYEPPRRVYQYRSNFRNNRSPKPSADFL